MKKLLIMSCLFVLGTFVHVKAQVSTFKALFLYNFTQNIEWPATVGTNSDFIITVVGDNEIFAELEKLSKVKKVGTKKLLIQQANNVKDIGDTHMVFLGSSKSSLMPILDSYQKDKQVLLVADKSGLCQQGAGIAFTMVDGKLRFEISPERIESHGLKVAQKLIALGEKVH